MMVMTVRAVVHLTSRTCLTRGSCVLVRRVSPIPSTRSRWDERHRWYGERDRPSAVGIGGPERHHPSAQCQSKLKAPRASNERCEDLLISQPNHHKQRNSEKPARGDRASMIATVLPPPPSGPPPGLSTRVASPPPPQGSQT